MEMSWGFCPNCRKVVNKGVTACPNCGYSLLDQNTPEPQKYNVKSEVSDSHQGNKDSSRHFSVWCFLSIASLMSGIISFIKGINRLTQYENSEYSWGEHINAYVGGDAYNYIINGTHATAFFVLTAMFVLSAIGLLVVHYLSLSRE